MKPAPPVIKAFNVPLFRSRIGKAITRPLRILPAIYNSERAPRLTSIRMQRARNTPSNARLAYLGPPPLPPMAAVRGESFGRLNRAEGGSIRLRQRRVDLDGFLVCRLSPGFVTGSKPGFG